MNPDVVPVSPWTNSPNDTQRYIWPMSYTWTRKCPCPGHVPSHIALCWPKDQWAAGPLGQWPTIMLYSSICEAAKLLSMCSLAQRSCAKLLVAGNVA